MPNFVEIAQTTDKICQFLIFQDGGRRHLGFLKFQIVDTAPACQISSKSVKPRPMYGVFSILQDGGGRHRGFVKFQIFNSRGGREVRNASSRKILSKSVELRLRYRYF